MAQDVDFWVLTRSPVVSRVNPGHRVKHLIYTVDTVLYTGAGPLGPPPMPGRPQAAIAGWDTEVAKGAIWLGHRPGPRPGPAYPPSGALCNFRLPAGNGRPLGAAVIGTPEAHPTVRRHPTANPQNGHFRLFWHVLQKRLFSIWEFRTFCHFPPLWLGHHPRVCTLAGTPDACHLCQVASLQAYPPECIP